MSKFTSIVVSGSNKSAVEDLIMFVTSLFSPSVVNNFTDEDNCEISSIPSLFNTLIAFSFNISNLPSFTAPVVSITILFTFVW